MPRSPTSSPVSRCSNLDQLIRDLHEAGGLDGPFAREYINLRARWLELLPRAMGWSQEQAAEKRRIALGNLARELFWHLQQATADPTKSRTIPEHYDPDPGPHRRL